MRYSSAAVSGTAVTNRTRSARLTSGIMAPV